MNLSWIQFLIICPLVGVAGFIDAIAGGGGLITLPAYLLAGLPVHSAIATNKLSSSMGTATSVARYAKSGYVKWKQAAFCVVCAFIGSAIGAKIALLVSDRYFKILMLVILPLTAFYVTRPHALRTDKEPYNERKTIILSMLAAFVLGIYDGFYGPGTGSFLILLMTGLARMSLENAQGVSKVINLSSNIAALTVYLINGKTVILLGLAAGLFGMTGNYLGSKYFIQGGVKIARPMMLAVISLFFVKVILELTGVL